MSDFKFTVLIIASISFAYATGYHVGREQLMKGIKEYIASGKFVDELRSAAGVNDKPKDTGMMS